MLESRTILSVITSLMSLLPLVKLKYYLDVIVVIDWDARHSYNIFLYPNGETQTYEPQNDTFSPEGSHYSPGSKSIMYFP